MKAKALKKIKVINHLENGLKQKTTTTLVEMLQSKPREQVGKSIQIL
jgi:hypothetical protein